MDRPSRDLHLVKEISPSRKTHQNHEHQPLSHRLKRSQKIHLSKETHLTFSTS